MIDTAKQFQLGCETRLQQYRERRVMCNQRKDFTSDIEQALELAGTCHATENVLDSRVGSLEK
jgi:hypothetical protein